LTAEVADRGRAGVRAVIDAALGCQRGLDACAMVPASAGGSAFSPVVGGGGSVGYNEYLRRGAW